MRRRSRIALVTSCLGPHPSASVRDEPLHIYLGCPKLSFHLPAQASVSRAVAVLGSDGFVLEVTVRVQVSSTAIDDGTDEGSSSMSNPAPTAGRRHLLAQSGRHLLQAAALSSKLDGVLSGLVRH